MPEPGSVVWVWALQWTTLITSIAVAVSVAVMKGYMTDVKNKKMWEGDDGNLPFKVSGNTVTLTDTQNIWFNSAYGFIALGLVAIVGFVHACMQNRREGQCWGDRGHRSGKKFLAQGVVAWIGTILGLVWLIYGFAGADVKTLNNKMLPNGSDGWTTPEIALTTIIAWASSSVLYSVVITIFYCAKKRAYKQYAEY